MTRSYRLGRRAESRERTRERIVEAAIALHQQKGVAVTSMGDIAARAGVGKVTVYRHFPDMGALLESCSDTYFARHPLPDPLPWSKVSDARERLRRGLAETYAYFRETEPMLASVYAEARDLPIMAPYHAHWRHAAEILAEPFRLRGRRKALLHAGLALALSFETWHRLVRREGLTDDQAAALMLRLCCDCPPDKG